MNEPVQRSWWSRNWKWVVPVGLVTPVLLCGAPIALILSVVFGAIKSSDVYTHSLATARANEHVKATLGEPVEPGFMLSGNININGPSGNANLAIPLSGPKASATLYVVAEKRAGKWEYSTMEVAPEGQGERIDLLAKP